jgi:hypothetical protein
LTEGILAVSAPAMSGTSSDVTSPPPRYRVTSDPGRLEVRIPWTRSIALRLAGPAVGVLVATLVATAMMGDPRSMVMLFAFGALPLVPVLYITLAFLLNETTLTAGDDGLTVTNGPLPWPGTRRRRDELTKVFVDEALGPDDPAAWKFCALLGDGKTLVLLRGFTRKSEARWLDAAVNQALALRDAPELPRS